MSRETPAWADVNSVTLRGRLGRDPEIRSTQNGGQIANLSVATSESWKDKANGERKERTQWHRVVVLFNEPLVNVAAGLHKGQRVRVVGKLTYRKWTTKDGAEKWETEIECGRFDAELEAVVDDRQAAPAPGRKPAPVAADLDDEVPF